MMHVCSLSARSRVSGFHFSGFQGYRAPRIHSCRFPWFQSSKISEFRDYSPRVPSKVQAEIPASQFQPGIVVFHCLPQFEKRKKQNKTQRKSRNCLHIGSSKFAKQFQQGQARLRLPTSQPGTLSKARNNIQRMKSTPALVPSKIFHPGVPARGFQRGSSQVSPGSSGFPAMPHQGSSQV